MGDVPPPKDGRAAIRKLTLIMPPLVWGMAFLLSRFLHGCDTQLALTKATAYAISGTIGWLVYLLLWRPKGPRVGPLSIIFQNPLYLGKTVTPQPFHEMLFFGVSFSIVAGAILIGALSHWFERRGGFKPPNPSSNHPLFDDQVS